MKKGIFVLVTGASASGKTTVVNELLSVLPSAARMVTSTTRDPREGEVHGKDYFFLSRDEFEAGIERGDFLEWFENYGNLYGSSRVELERLLAEHEVVFGILDIKGSKVVQKEYPDCVSVFLFTPVEDLKNRIESRGENTPEEIEARLNEAQHENSEAANFNYTVPNREGKLARTVGALQEIISRRQAREA
jgi:guanylate kinase